MIKAHNIKCNARSRRDERRKAKQQAFAEANPLLVGRRYTKVGKTVWFVYKAHYQPKDLNAIAKNIFRSVIEYRNQIIRATYLYEYEFKRQPVTEGPICLPEVAKYYASHRKTGDVTAR